MNEINKPTELLGFVFPFFSLIYVLANSAIQKVLVLISGIAVLKMIVIAW
ncbi:MAG: hypothetical protein Q8R54_03020 [Methylobacter sp.]|nr:hypothetical protein [Methylobacter sp.]